MMEGEHSKAYREMKEEYQEDDRTRDTTNAVPGEVKQSSHK